MKLSKKIVAVILTVAMVVAQVSVFPFAENSYASGLGDGASYALKVPELESVTRDTADVTKNWILSSATIGRKSDDSGYASNTSGYIFTVTDSGERFFKLTPSADKAYVTFVNAPYHTYSSESPRIYNGIPASVGSVSGMVFRVKGLATANKTMGLEISIGNKTGASATYIGQTDVMFVDANTGAVTALTYSATEGYSLPGNANGYIYIPVAGFETTAGATLEADFTDVATTSTSSNLGFRSIRYRFLGTSFNNETALIGDAFVVDSFDNFKKVHSAPAAPTLLEATATSIKVNAVAGVKYSIDGETWNTTGVFENLEEATNYVVYAKYDVANAKVASSANLSTKGVVAPILLDKTHTSLTVEVKEGQVYSIDGETWVTTGLFEGLTASTLYTIYTKAADDAAGEIVKSAEFATSALPYASGADDGAYSALKVPDGTSSLESNYVAVTGSIAASLPMTALDSEKFITFVATEGKDGTASIKAPLLTYGVQSGFPSDMVKKDEFTAFALRIRTAGADTAAAFGIKIGDYQLASGEYTFFDAKTGAQSLIAFSNGFTVTTAIDGWLILPFNKFYGEGTLLNITRLTSYYQNIEVDLHGVGCTHGQANADWTDKTFYLGNSFFLTDVDAFLKTRAVPATPVVLDKTKESITLEIVDGVEVSIDNGETWVTNGEFTGLTVETQYAFLARFIGKTKALQFNVSTRLANPELKTPVLASKTQTSITVAPMDDHEFSIDNGATWTEQGKFVGLTLNTKYSIIARIVGTEEPFSAPLTVRTDASQWATGSEDSTSYIYVIPEAEHWEQAWGWGGAPLWPEGTDGSKPPIKTIDGERFVELTCYKAGSGYLGMTFKPYSGVEAGLPTDIGWDDADAVAVRIKFTNMDDKISQLKIYTDTGAGDSLIMGTGATYWVDKNTGVVTPAGTASTFNILSDFDGWLVVTKDAIYHESRQPLEWMRDSWKGITPWLVEDGGLNSTWIREDGEQEYCYFGNTLLVADLDAFFIERSAPAEPQLISKTKDSIYVKPADGVEFSIDGVTWTTSGAFTGLTPNTTYTVKARYIDKAVFSSHTWFTDLENPELVEPQNPILTETTIKVDVVPGLEYSIDGKTWNEDGVWAGLRPEREFTVSARIKGTEETKSIVVTTLAYPNPYLTDLSPGTSWVTRIPDPAVEPTLGYPKWGWSSGKIEPTGAGGKTIPTVEKDGEFFAEYKLYTVDGKRSDGSMPLSTKNMYGAAGLPISINIEKVEAFIFRLKTEGMDGTKAALTAYTDTNKGNNISMASGGEFYYIDPKTGKIETKTAGAFTFYEDFDGYVVVPISNFWNESRGQTPEWMETTWAGFNFWLHEGDTCSHGQKDSNWENKVLYRGNEYVTRDMASFIQLYSAPAAPQLESKTYDTITLKPIDGALYRANGGEWQESNVFTNLNENTEYTFEAKYAIGSFISDPFTVHSDMKDPPLTPPEIIGLTDEYVTVKVVPGLEYTVDSGVTWDELGVLGILDPNTEYTLYARSKNTKVSSEGVKFTTPKAPNPYDLGDGSSKWFTMTRYKERYNEYWFPDCTGWNADYTKGAPNWQGGWLDVVTDENGERFINYKIHTGNGDNFSISGNGTYGVSAGFPRGIWVRDSFGISIRIKFPDCGQDDIYFDLYKTVEGKQVGCISSGKPIYLIDKAEGTWTKEIHNGSHKLNGFDGWMLIPFASMGMKSNQVAQETFSNIQFFRRAKEEVSDWNKVDFYIGESVVVNDPELYVSVHAPNTEERIVGIAHNKTTDPSIPAIMANDCSGNEISDGLYAVNGVRVTKRSINKPNELSEALLLDPNAGITSVSLANDSLSYKEISQDHLFQVLDSLGVSFYVEIPDTISGKFGIDMEILEDGTEFFNFSKSAYYYTIADGLAKKNYGPIELQPGFKGYVMLPFDNFEVNLDYSEYVDGMLFSPDTIEYFALVFDTEMYPAVNEGTMVVDDIFLYQDVEAFITSILKIQGNNTFNIIDNVQTFRKDENPEFPRNMANDCTNIDLKKGIYSSENIALAVKDKANGLDSFVNITIGEKASSVMFKNHAFYDDMDSDLYDEIMASEGVSFDISVPKDALMTVGLDFEVLEEECEYYLYDADKFYYTVSNGEVYKVFGYLEFEPGFEGTVIIPFENFFFDEGYSDYIDGELTAFDLIDYFGFYFNTSYYASIGGTVISVDNIALYQGHAYDYIDAIWASQTKKK